MIGLESIDRFLTKITKKIDKNELLTVFLATFVIGIIAHGFCYSNSMFAHDAAEIAFNPPTLIETLAGSRWTLNFFFSMAGNSQVGWLIGFITLFIYSIVSLLLIKIFEIKNKFLMVLLSALVVTSPTAISSNLYLSSAHAYAGSFLFATLALYFIYKGGKHYILAGLFMFLCEGTYAAYISVTLSFFLVKEIVNIIKNNYKKEDFIKVFSRHIVVVVLFVVTMLISAILIKIFVADNQSLIQPRTTAALNGGIQYYITQIIVAVGKVILDFINPNRLSFFKYNKVLYILLLISLVISIVCYIYRFLNKKCYKYLWVDICLLVDVIFLPLAVNIIGVMYYSHSLMWISYLIPWIFCLLIYNFIINNMSVSNIEKFQIISTILCIIYTIYSMILLSNMAYLKANNNYESGMALANRIVDRIEEIDGYVPGETPVIFAGDLKEYYANDVEGFEILDSINGAGSPDWDTAFTYGFPFYTYIQQELKINMNIINYKYGNGIDGTTISSMLKNKYDFNDNECIELTKSIDDLNAFPSRDCYIIRKGIIIFKLGNY